MFRKIIICVVAFTGISSMVALNIADPGIAASVLEHDFSFHDSTAATTHVEQNPRIMRVAQGPLKYQIGPGHQPRQQPQDPEPEPEPISPPPPPTPVNPRNTESTHGRYSQIISELVRSIEKGSEQARQEIGKLCRATESMNFIRSAADSGDADAQFILGRAYHLGVGVSTDYGLAHYWYTKAAEQESAAAECNLGYMYRSGKGVTRDRSNARYWFSRAAQHGDTDAQSMIANEYKY